MSPPDPADETAPTTSGLTAGVARADITPETGRSFQGYVRPDIRANGVALRLFARALVLADGDRKVALVSADLLYGIDKEAVLDHVRPLGFTSETLLHAGTHTHAASEAGEWTAAQVGTAIAQADANRQPAVAGWATASVTDINRNRSLEAHLANHGLDLYPGTGSRDLDPCGPDHPRETTLRLLRVEGRDGAPLAAWCQFPVHPTAFTPHNTTYSADLVGVALRRFRSEVGAIALFANGNAGDLIPVYDDYNQHALADRLGGKLADGMVDAWERAGDSLTTSLQVEGHGTSVTYDRQTVEGERVASRALFGLPFLGGAENGPSFFYGLGLEGHRRPPLLADSVHGRKIPVAPAPWDATVEVQLLRVGDCALLAVPGEPTVEMGRRSRDAVAETAPISEVVVVGMANEYNGYFTTPEEYDQQHYEGGHTTFGKHSEALLRRTYVELAEQVGADGAQPDADSQHIDSPASDEDPPVGETTDGRLVREPTGPLERMSVVTVEWHGGPEGRDRPVGEPFVRVEREQDGWETVVTDLGQGIVWTVDGRGYTARFEIPRTLDTGTYRLRVTGAGYDLPTRTFEVVPSTGLRLRGVELEDGQLVFRAQHPPPDPDRHLRTRPVSPSGGSLAFTFEGTDRTATWDGDRGGWTASVEDVTPGDTVTVPAGGLVDGVGNTSGEGTTVEVGELAAPKWPPDIGPANGRPPGPFGFGTWPL